MADNAPDTTTTSTQQEPRVIILGCGLAGLKCARQLVVENGMDKDRILLLEASTNIGGRIKTNKDFVEGFSVRPLEGSSFRYVCFWLSRSVSVLVLFIDLDAVVMVTIHDRATPLPEICRHWSDDGKVTHLYTSI